MRSTSLYAVLAATLALTSTAAFAQTATTQTEVETTATSTTTTTFTQTTPRILSVALPPNARLRMDVNARDEELLGVVKSMLRGFKGQSLKELLASPLFMGVPATTGNSAAGNTSVDVTQAAAIQLLSDADLGTILRDIDHMRVVFFETSYSGRYTSRSASRPTAQSVISFYEQAYITREGGHRIARMDFDEMQVLAVGFPNRGFAFVVQAPGMGFVARANGYPNFEGVGPLAMGMSMLLAPKSR